MNIKNVSKVPLTISLPGGKKLRLGPGKVGQITAKAAANPSVAKMVEAGQIQLTEAGAAATGRSGGGMGAVGAAQKRGGGGAARQSGDR